MSQATEKAYDGAAAQPQANLDAVIRQTQSVRDMIAKSKASFAEALPSVGIKIEAFLRNAHTEIMQQPRLAGCTHESLKRCLMYCARYGLLPGGILGDAYLIPYQNKGVLEAQFQIGYKGLMRLARRSGEIKDIAPEEVYAGDVYKVTLGTNRCIVHEPAPDRGDFPDSDIIAVYAVAEWENGNKSFIAWPRAKIDSHMRRYSKSWQKSDSAWKTAFAAMARKTVLIQLCKLLPLSAEVQGAIAMDELTLVGKAQPAVDGEIEAPAVPKVSRLAGLADQLADQLLGEQEDEGGPADEPIVKDKSQTEETSPALETAPTAPPATTGLEPELIGDMRDMAQELGYHDEQIRDLFRTCDVSNSRKRRFDALSAAEASRVRNELTRRVDAERLAHEASEAAPKGGQMF